MLCACAGRWRGRPGVKHRRTLVRSIPTWYWSLKGFLMRVQQGTLATRTCRCAELLVHATVTEVGEKNKHACQKVPLCALLNSPATCAYTRVHKTLECINLHCICPVRPHSHQQRPGNDLTACPMRHAQYLSIAPEACSRAYSNLCTVLRQAILPKHTKDAALNRTRGVWP